MSQSVDIPVSALSDEALNGLIEEFVTREGTEYGFHEVSLHTKVEQVKRALNNGDAVIQFDEESQEVRIFNRKAAC